MALGLPSVTLVLIGASGPGRRRSTKKDQSGVKMLLFLRMASTNLPPSAQMISHATYGYLRIRKEGENEEGGYLMALSSGRVMETAYENNSIK